MGRWFMALHNWFHGCTVRAVERHRNVLYAVPPGPLRRTQSEFHLCSVQRRIVCKQWWAIGMYVLRCRETFKCAVDNSEASAGWKCYSVARHRSCRQCDHVRLPKRQLLCRFKFDGMRFVWTWFDLPRHRRSHRGCWILRGFVSGCGRELVPLLWCQPNALSWWSSWLLR